MELAQFDFAYMFSYSMRKKTHAYHRLEDDVSDENKKERLKQLIDLQYKIQKNINKEQIGKMLKVLVEREGKREGQVMGKSDNKKVFLNGDKSLIG